MAQKKLSLANVTLGKEKPVTPMVPAIAPEPAQPEKRKGQTLRLTPGAWRQLKHLATDLDKSAHDLLIEAVNDVFTKYGKPPIA
jgi:hypothetical protein